MSRRIFPCQSGSNFPKLSSVWNWGQGRKLFLPAAFFSPFRLAVIRINPTGRKKGSNHMNQLIQPKTFTTFIVWATALVCFGLCQVAPAVNPPPDGGYPGSNTAEG